MREVLIPCPAFYEIFQASLHAYLCILLDPPSLLCMMRGTLLDMNLLTLVFPVTDGMVLALDTLISNFFFSQDLTRTIVLNPVTRSKLHDVND